jgi:hypothetical protein
MSAPWYLKRTATVFASTNRPHRGHYKKTTTAMNLFPIVDPKVAVQKCPYLRLLMEDLLRVAQILQ